VATVISLEWSIWYTG